VAIAYGAATAAAIALAWLGGQARSDLMLPGLLVLCIGLGALSHWQLRRHFLDLRSKKDLRND
jgi:hypothetical protein